jgi:hypothetical protein
MNPYKNLPEKAFWKTSVANKNMFDIDELWTPKFSFKRADYISTFGSCFAQHIGKALHVRGYNWFDAEKPIFGMSDELKTKYNYGIFSSRTGNIYTTSLLLQWVNWALNKIAPPNEYWLNDGRYIDPFRPVIEPDGFFSLDEMLDSREKTISSFRKIIKKSDVFIFTLGLTESWFNKEFGYEYPMCPGTVAGVFDDDIHVFNNQKFEFIKLNLINSINLMRKYNPKLKFILTVSPVPLTATNSGEHVLVATQLSKSLLRSVAGDVAGLYDFVDYFPSYEIISSTPFRGTFYAPNQRSVIQKGVNHVMDNFFACLQNPEDELVESNNFQTGSDIVCEEELLSAFSDK